MGAWGCVPDPNSCLVLLKISLTPPGRFLTFRDSPALVRQESDDLPHTPCCFYPIADRPSPLPFSNLDEPMTA